MNPLPKTSPESVFPWITTTDGAAFFAICAVVRGVCPDATSAISDEMIMNFSRLAAPFPPVSRDVAGDPTVFYNTPWLGASGTLSRKLIRSAPGPDWGESMTLAEISELGRLCLIDYEGRLNVKGIMPYDASAEAAKRRIDEQLDRITPGVLKSAIGVVLDQLAEMKSGFVMSEPTEWAKPGVPTATARHKNLRMTFFYPSSVSDGSFRLWIFCWYYPA